MHVIRGLCPLEGAAHGLGFCVETIEFCFNLFCSCTVISRFVLQNPSVFISRNDDACGVTEEQLRGTRKEDRLAGIVGRRDAQKVRCQVSCERWAIESNRGRQRDSAAIESSGQISVEERNSSSLSSGMTGGGGREDRRVNYLLALHLVIHRIIGSLHG